MTPTIPMISRTLAGGVLALALALPLSAQAESQEASENGRVTADDIQAEFDDAFEAIGAYSEEQRDKAVKATRETLSQIDAEMDRLEQRTRENWDEMSKATQERTRKALETLRERRNELSEAFGALQEGSRSAWSNLQDGVADAWSDVKAAWKAAFDASKTDDAN